MQTVLRITRQVAFPVMILASSVILFTATEKIKYITRSETYRIAQDEEFKSLPAFFQMTDIEGYNGAQRALRAPYSSLSHFIPGK